jgi:hypothetical protein
VLRDPPTDRPKLGPRRRVTPAFVKLCARRLGMPIIRLLPAGNFSETSRQEVPAWPPRSDRKLHKARGSCKMHDPVDRGTYARKRVHPMSVRAENQRPMNGQKRRPTLQRRHVCRKKDRLCKLAFRRKSIFGKDHQRSSRQPCRLFLKDTGGRALIGARWIRTLPPRSHSASALKPMSDNSALAVRGVARA